MSQRYHTHLVSYDPATQRSSHCSLSTLLWLCCQQEPAQDNNIRLGNMASECCIKKHANHYALFTVSKSIHPMGFGYAGKMVYLISLRSVCGCHEVVEQLDFGSQCFLLLCHGNLENRLQLGADFCIALFFCLLQGHTHSATAVAAVFVT